MTKPDNPVLMAVIGAPHGVRGELRVKTFTGDALALGDYGTLFDKAGNRFDVKAIRPAKTVVVVRFSQVNNREEAEAANGTELFVDRSQLPDDLLEDEEFYIADLVGLKACNDGGAATGQIIAVHNFGAGDLLEVAPFNGSGGVARKQSYLVEFSRETVPDIDIGKGSLTLIRPGEIEARGDGAEEA